MTSRPQSKVYWAIMDAKHDDSRLCLEPLSMQVFDHLSGPKGFNAVPHYGDYLPNIGSGSMHRVMDAIHDAAGDDDPDDEPT